MTPNVRKTNMLDRYININRETLLVMIGFLGSISLLVSLVFDLKMKLVLILYNQRLPHHWILHIGDSEDNDTNTFRGISVKAMHIGCVRFFVDRFPPSMFGCSAPRPAWVRQSD